MDNVFWGTRRKSTKEGVQVYFSALVTILRSGNLQMDPNRVSTHSKLYRMVRVVPGGLSGSILGPMRRPSWISRVSSDPLPLKAPALVVSWQNTELVKIGSGVQVLFVAEIFPLINAHKIRTVEFNT